MERIVVLDFGGQYAHLIARRVRSLGVYAEIEKPTLSDFKDVKGIILSGGPSSVYDATAPKYNKDIFEQNIPVLGICYGMQLMARDMGGNVTQLPSKEYGKASVKVLAKKSIFTGLSDSEQVWMSHGDSINEAPNGFEVIGETENCPIAAFASKTMYGIQFHPEVTHTPNGMKILENFLDLCDIQHNWTSDNYIEPAIEEIKKQVGDGHVLMASSGGVDSTVASVLLHRAIGENIYCVFVDTGLVRKYETNNTKKVFEKEGFEHLIVIEAADEFFEKLKGVTEPEAKRKVISETFFKLFQEKASELSEAFDIKFLGQGTIYPDRIESAEPSTHADKIKSHHNVLLPDWLHLELVEPLKDFYKDEVREIGLKLGIDRESVIKHPFPGPGLGVRILGELNRKKVDLYKEIDVIVEDKIRKAGWYEKLWMGFPVLVPVQEFDSTEEGEGVVGNVENGNEIVNKCNEVLKEYIDGECILLPVKSVGVMGDARTYQNPVCIITDNTDYDKLETVSNELINRVKGVNRVILHLDGSGWDDLIVIRAVTSKDAMTADWAKFEPKLLKDMASAIMKEGVGRVAYDITQKPPGTMEWE